MNLRMKKKMKLLSGLRITSLVGAYFAVAWWIFK
jgi:hypothetical protein